MTTSGSPQPWENRHATMEHIDIRDDGISSSKLLPQVNMAFRIRNLSGSAHALVLTGAHTHREFPLLDPGKTVFIPIPLTDPHYTLTCRLPGHRERGSFDTYRPQE